ITSPSGCKLAFANQPAETAVKTAVQDAKWGSVYSPASGNPIKIEVLKGNTVVPGSGSAVISSNCSFTGDSTTTVNFGNDGFAYASNLKPASVVGSPGCTLTAVQSSAGYADSDPSSAFNVDPVELYFKNQPADVVVNTPLRDVKYGFSTNPQTGNSINVGVQVRSPADSSTQSLTGTGTIAPSGTVSVQANGSGCTFTNDSNTGPQGFTSGTASFLNLKMKNVVPAPGCTLTAQSSAGYSDSSQSSSFIVTSMFCPDPNNCTITQSDGNKFPDTSTVTTSGAQALTLLFTSPNTSAIPDNASCKADLLSFYTDPQGNTPSLALVFVDPVATNNPPPGFNGTYSTTMQVVVAKHWVQLDPNNGNPFIDMCFAAKRIDKATGQPIPCNATQPADSTGVGWIAKNGSPAGCASDGNYWAFIGGPNDNIPAIDPHIVSATAGPGGSRILTISLGAVTANQTWYWDAHHSP
ncbi:MAG: hypothetical protein C5B48_07525, partial [Candidatus Rokuibacteriota bacterium]